MESLGLLFGIMFAYMAFISLLSLAVEIFRIVCNAFIFEKAGREGWKAIIPFYNLYTFYKVCGFNGWFFLMEFIPVVGLVFHIFTCINLCDAFKKSTGYIFGLIFLPDIFRAIIAFDKSQYNWPTRIQL